MLWKFNSVYDPVSRLADHARPVLYEMPLPPKPTRRRTPLLYIHRSQGRAGRVLDDATEQFVETTRMGRTGLNVSPASSEPESGRALPGLALPEHVVAQFLGLGTHGGERGKTREQFVRMRAFMILERAPVGDDHVVILRGLG